MHATEQRPRWAVGEEAVALAKEYERRKASHLQAGGRIVEGEVLRPCDRPAAESDADDRSVSHLQLHVCGRQ